MELNLRPMTEAERLYCYTQSQQIMAQTGCVGHLRADMDTDGRGFFSSWDDHIGYLKTQEFKDEFEVVIDSLRFDSGVLANRTAVQKFCAAHPEAQITPDRPDYGFRTDTVQYAYLFRLNPNKGEYNLYCYCYRYIDNYHMEVGSSSCNLFHICEFAERMEASCAVVEPAGAVIEHNQESREKDRSDAR